MTPEHAAFLHQALRDVRVRVSDGSRNAAVATGPRH
jgi:hypothetical protein